MNAAPSVERARGAGARTGPKPHHALPPPLSPTARVIRGVLPVLRGSLADLVRCLIPFWPEWMLRSLPPYY